MPSLASKAKKSKLNTIETRSVAGVVSKKKQQKQPTSIRLTENDKNILRDIVENLDMHLAKNASEGDAIRALIHIGSKMDIKKILKAYRENL